MNLDLMQIEELRMMEQRRDDINTLPPGFDDDITSLIHELRSRMAGSRNYHERDQLHDEIKSIITSYQGLMSARREKIIGAAIISKQVDRNNLLDYEWSLYDEIRGAVAYHEEYVDEPINTAYKNSLVVS